MGVGVGGRQDRRAWDGEGTSSAYLLVQIL